MRGEPSAAGGRVRSATLALVLAVGGAAVAGTAIHAFRANDGPGFPLDDPWIHLQFARNLAEHGRFAYFPGDPATSGSTSPLHTLLLAAGFLVTGNEWLLGYALGTIFLLLAGACAFRLAEREAGLLGGAAAALAVVLEPRLIWAALSGMETPLFAFLLLAALLAYREGRAALLGAALGLAVWARPEGILFVLVLAADGVARSLMERPGATPRSPLRGARVWLVLGAALLLYAGFNLALSGTILPNTFAAKRVFYAAGNREYPVQTWRFLADGHGALVLPLAALGALGVLVRLARRRETVGLPELLWTGGLVLAYGASLPNLYQNGRYLMPVLPFVILLAVRGAWDVAAAAIPRPSTGVALRAAAALVLVAAIGGASLAAAPRYAEKCAYIRDRQVRTAFWIRDHLPASAVVATHDIGAIGFYSGRRVVDMVGLVSPDLIPHLGDLDALPERLGDRGATHVAVLRNWFVVVNANPLFGTDEARPEVMDLYALDLGRIRFVPVEAGILMETAARALALGRPADARRALDRSLLIDERNAMAHLLLGRVFVREGDLRAAGGHYRRALALQPDAWDARFYLSEVSMREGKPEEAAAELERLLAENPSHERARRALEAIRARIASGHGSPRLE